MLKYAKFKGKGSIFLSKSILKGVLLKKKKLKGKDKKKVASIPHFYNSNEKVVLENQNNISKLKSIC